MAQQEINVRELLDNRDISGYQKFIVFLCFLIVVMDGFDVVIMGFVGPALKEAWKWSNDDLAPVLSAGMASPGSMPHKVSTAALLGDERITDIAKAAGSVNAVRKRADGSLEGAMFDGEGFVRGLQNKGFAPQGKTALIVGSGGVGSAIAASLAAAGIARLALYDLNPQAAQTLGARLQRYFPALEVVLDNNDPQGVDLLVNATPMGMNPGDAMPVDINRISPETFVGDVVLQAGTTAFLQACQDKGCPIQVGLDMLFEQIPVYLEYFGLPTTTAQQLRELADIRY